MVREKIIRALTPRWLSAHWFELDVLAGAGTYIKEFVHGDLGRTRPSVADLLSAPPPSVAASSDASNDASDASNPTAGGAAAAVRRPKRCRTDILELDVLAVHTTGVLA